MILIFSSLLISLECKRNLVTNFWFNFVFASQYQLITNSCVLTKFLSRTAWILIKHHLSKEWNPTKIMSMIWWVFPVICEDSPYNPLEHIFRTCLNYKIFPWNCKKAKVVPIYENNDKRVVSFLQIYGERI